MPRVIHIATVDMTVRLLLLPSLCALNARGYIVEAACHVGHWRSEIEHAGIRLHHIGGFTRRINPLRDIIALGQLLALLRRERPDIVHTHTPKANLLGSIASRLAGVPIVISMEHGFYFVNKKGFSKAFYIALSRLGALLSDKTLVINQYDFDLALKERIVEKDNLILSPAGLGVNLYRFRIEVNNELLKSELNIDKDSIVIIFIGRLNLEKGCRELIRAAGHINSNFQKICLLMVGPSENKMQEELGQLVLKLNLERRVLFLGERQDIPQLLAVSDMLVLPSYREGLGMVLLEAAAAGKPAVTTDIRGCRDVVVHGETGLLIPPYAVQELAEAILDLLQNANKRKRMGEAARRRAEEKFDQNLFFDQIDNLYRHLLKEKGIYLK